MFNQTDYKHFDKARRAALISDFRRAHVGCVAIYRGQVVGLGCNCNKTHPTQKFYNKYRYCDNGSLPKLHAEINCLNQLKNVDVIPAKVKLYIYRIRKDQPYGMARPCLSCMAAIKDFGIRDIYYTSDSGYCYERIN